jgi:hypothetical protein
MFTFRRKRSGNRYTFVSIVLILIIVYLFRMMSPHKEVEYSDIVQYNNIRYVYMETIKSSPFIFVRKRPVSDEGYIILARRGISIQEELYIYEGPQQYRRYVVLKE